MNKKNTQLNKSIFIDKYISELKRCLDVLDRKEIGLVIDLLMSVYKKNKKIFIMGNGGSASNASHMAADLGKGTLLRIYDEDEKRFRVLSLTDNIAYLTALANDLSYEDIFVQQLRNLLEKGDLLIVLSGMGNSANLIKAVRYAKKVGARSIGFLGFKNGGKLGSIVDLAIIVDSNSYGHSEDIQLILDHIITGWITKIKGGGRHSGKVR